MNTRNSGSECFLSLQFWDNAFEILRLLFSASKSPCSAHKQNQGLDIKKVLLSKRKAKLLECLLLSDVVGSVFFAIKPFIYWYCWKLVFICRASNHSVLETTAIQPVKFPNSLVSGLMWSTCCMSVLPLVLCTHPFSQRIFLPSIMGCNSVWVTMGYSKDMLLTIISLSLMTCSDLQS